MPVPTPIWRGALTLTEVPTSPQWESSEQLSCTKIYKGPYDLAVASMPSKGSLGTGDMLGFVVAKSTVTKERGAIGVLTIVWQPYGPGAHPLPPDEVDVGVMEINPRVEKCHRFSDVTPDDAELVRSTIYGASAADRENAYLTLLGEIGSPSGDEALNTVDLLNKGVENFYLSGFRYTWTISSWEPVDVNIGGYLESPGGPLAGSSRHRCHGFAQRMRKIGTGVFTSTSGLGLEGRRDTGIPSFTHKD